MYKPVFDCNICIQLRLHSYTMVFCYRIKPSTYAYMARTNAREVIDSILDKLQAPLQWSLVEVQYRKRIFKDLKNTAGESIPSASHLHKTGYLERTLSIDRYGITVAEYYSKLEKEYGVIFQFSDEELELIEKLWISRI